MLPCVSQWPLKISVCPRQFRGILENFWMIGAGCTFWTLSIVFIFPTPTMLGRLSLGDPEKTEHSQTRPRHNFSLVKCPHLCLWFWPWKTSEIFLKKCYGRFNRKKFFLSAEGQLTLASVFSASVLEKIYSFCLPLYEVTPAELITFI